MANRKVQRKASAKSAAAMLRAIASINGALDGLATRAKSERNLAVGSCLNLVHAMVVAVKSDDHQFFKDLTALLKTKSAAVDWDRLFIQYEIRCALPPSGKSLAGSKLEQINNRPGPPKHVVSINDLRRMLAANYPGVSVDDRYLARMAKGRGWKLRRPGKIKRVNRTD